MTMQVSGWIVVGGKTPDHVWGFHLDETAANAHANKLRNDGVAVSVYAATVEWE